MSAEQMTDTGFRNEVGEWLGAVSGMEAQLVPPSETALGEGELDFVEAPALTSMGIELVNRHDRFTPHRQIEIIYLWKGKGGKSGGSATLGKCQKTSGLLAHFAESEFVIWLAADHLRELMLSPKQVEALLFHELLHIDFDPEALKPMVRSHDWAGFTVEIEEYGLYLDDMRRVDNVMQQLRLPVNGERS